MLKRYRNSSWYMGPGPIRVGKKVVGSDELTVINLVEFPRVWAIEPPYIWTVTVQCSTGFCFNVLHN